MPGWPALQAAIGFSLTSVGVWRSLYASEPRMSATSALTISPSASIGSPHRCDPDLMR
jgi:hypothetical protein